MFLFGCCWRYSLTEVDKKFELKLSKFQICLYCKMKSKENRFWRKKVNKRAYSITTQKRKVFGIFDDKKVRNIDIDFSQPWIWLTYRIIDPFAVIYTHPTLHSIYTIYRIRNRIFPENSNAVSNPKNVSGLRIRSGPFPLYYL